MITVTNDGVAEVRGHKAAEQVVESLLCVLCARWLKAAGVFSI